MPSKLGPWFSDTWWGKRTAKINVTLTMAAILFLLWKSLF
jgi:F0F1-type ATP synthase membrane subunit a